MRRREFIGLIGGAAMSPIAVRAQQPAKMKRIAMVDPAVKVADMRIGGDSGYTLGLQELQRLGYIEGQNLIIDRFSADGKRVYGDLVAGILSTHPDVILASSTPLTRALKAGTSTIPIVAITGDPIRFGLISSLSHPGGNVTGVSVDAGVELWGKRLELLAEAVPRAHNVLFVSTQAAWEDVGGKATREAAQRLGISLMIAPVSFPINEQAYRDTFQAIQRNQADGLVIANITEAYAYRFLLVKLVQQIGLPTMFIFREQAEAGGLMSYSMDLKNVIRVAWGQVVEILRGSKPSEMPYVQGTRYELVINLKAAKAIGLTIPPELLARADEVIE
jgi:putative tryptophan/tyrosine transport system substrate-binding protein